MLRVREEPTGSARAAGDATDDDGYGYGPDYDPPDAPSWAREDLPGWVLPYVGKKGLDAEQLAATLGTFGILNYPLPR